METLIHGVEAAVMALVAFITLQIKNAQTTNKLEMSEKLHELHTDFAAKHAENQRVMAVHAKDDDGRFGAIETALKNIDRKLDRREVQ